MKYLNKLFNLCLASMAIVFMYSCQQDDIEVSEKNGIELILAGDRVDDGNSSQRADPDFPTVEEGGCDLSYASYAIVTINDNDYKIDIKQWGDDFKTNLIELDPGSYTVTSCQLYDEDDNPIFATPMEGSEFGKFVSQPLPIDIEVEQYRKIEYDMEVLCVEDFTPPMFGFTSWSISLKEVKNLCIFANFCEPDMGHQVATLEAYVYPDAENTSDEDLIWSGSADGDYESETEDNELLCLKFPYDANQPTEEQSYYVNLYINGSLFSGTIYLDRVDMINSEYGYLHLNEDCDGDFDFLETSYNVSWEDINDDVAPDGEDLLENDLDYNDFVLQTTVNTDMTTGHLNFQFKPLARGGTYTHAFKMWFPGTGYVISGDAESVLTEGGNTVVTVYSNTNQAFNPNASFINVICGETTGTGVERTVTIENAPEEFTYYLVNPFTANLEVAGDAVYDLMIGDMFELSTFTKDGETFRNGLVTPLDWQWPQENVDIRTIYGVDFETNFTPISNTDDLYANCPEGA
ncbi:DUF4842 domain-containing protein [Marivirga sp. S37H4]|uniref:DUF4842 domain-containing protein n=1 Tax=Marivirga aurantiaca TaxID=2802615 RepID=A0A934WX15_9BACT|nr:DUF4842 domain-containing protein [Marivirga aurantiaca]MBK6264683.1 DUF4842 domain-containing protein [Marivirga aurantiaca]